jgi:hypothetical protein
MLSVVALFFLSDVEDDDNGGHVIHKLTRWQHEQIVSGVSTPIAVSDGL